MIPDTYAVKPVRGCRSRRRICATSAAAFVVSLSSLFPLVTVRAQRPAENVRTECAKCAIQVRQLYKTRDPNGSLSDPAYSLFEVAGELVVGARAPLQRFPVVFDSTGQYLRDIGRPGQGPGEIDVPVWTALLAGDTIRVFTPGRVSDFTTAGTFVRATAQLGGAVFVNALRLFPSGTQVIVPAGPGRPAGRDMYPLVVRGPDGSVLRRLELLDTGGELLLRVLGRARDHEAEKFWVAQSGPFNRRGYSLMLVSTDGKVHRSLVHEPSWWLSLPSGPRGSLTGPISRVADVRERSDGTLLVIVSQAKPGWRSIPTTPKGGMETRYEARLLAIDLRTTSVVGMATIPRGSSFISDSRLVVQTLTKNGEPELTVFEIRLP
jgi:hypothetical protein